MVTYQLIGLNISYVMLYDLENFASICYIIKHVIILYNFPIIILLINN